MRIVLGALSVVVLGAALFVGFNFFGAGRETAATAQAVGGQESSALQLASAKQDDVTAQEPTNRSRAQILLADLSWNSSQVDQYLNLFGTREGRAVLMPATSQRIECERQVAALDSLRLMLQNQPSIGDNLTEYRLTGMREHAVDLGACDGVVAQIDRIKTVRRTLAATVTAVAPALEECTDSNWRWNNPACATGTIASPENGHYLKFFREQATQCQISTVWRMARSQGWDAGVFMARHYLDMRFDGRVLDESVCGPTPAVAQRPAQ